MEKRIRRPIAIVLGMPCAKDIHRASYNQYSSCLFTSRVRPCVHCAHTHGRVAHNYYQQAEIAQPCAMACPSGLWLCKLHSLMRKR